MIREQGQRDNALKVLRQSISHLESHTDPSRVSFMRTKRKHYEKQTHEHKLHCCLNLR